MLLSVNMAPQNQQERVAQWSSLASCGIQHCLVGKAKAHRGQPISWKALHHPNATVPHQHGKREMQRVVQDFKVVQEQLLEDQEHDNKVILKQQKEKYQYDANGIQEHNYPKEQHDLQSLHKQEGHQEEQHDQQHDLQSLHKQKYQEEHHILVQEQEIDIVTVQEQEHCEQELDLSTVQEQGQVQEQEYGLKKAQRLEYLQDHQQYSNKVQKLQQPETQEDLFLEKNEELKEQEHLNVKEQGNLRNEKEFLQMPSEKQENLKLVKTQEHLHEEPQLIFRGVEEQQLQQEHQHKFRKVKLQPLKKRERKQYQYQDEVSVPDNCVVPDQLQPEIVKVLHTLQPMRPCIYQQGYQNEYINILPENRAVKSTDKRKACSEDKQDRRKAVRSSFGHDVQLQGFILYPVFAEGKGNCFEDVEDHPLDKKKFESSDDYHFEKKNQKGFSVNCMDTKPFDGLEQRDVMKVSEELDFCSEKNFVLEKSDKKHLLPKRVQELKNGDSYKRSFSTKEVKQESLGELKAKFENQKDVLAQKSKDLKGFNSRPFNSKDTVIQKAKLLDPQTNKELDCQEGLHSNSPKINTTEDQLYKHSNKELKAPTDDDKEQCTSWGNALVKCLKELQARTSRRHILHEFGHSGSCMVASCRPSCRLFRRLRHHVVNAQHRCSLFHLYTTLLHEHVSVCSSPTCGLRACPAIRANRRVHTPVASPTTATPCVTSAQVEIPNKM